MTNAHPANRPDIAPHCKILVIDDEEGFRSFITKFLTRSGFEPLVARDGEEGLALARTASPDLVLCDLEMPGVDGFQVLKRIQDDPSLTILPVIFLTGRSEPAMVRCGMNLGADDYLTKPVNGEDLLSAIKARLARVRQRRHATTFGAAHSAATLDDNLLIKTLKQQHLIKIRHLTHILAYGEYSWVYWEKGKGVMLRKPLKQWLVELPAGHFIRIHRGAIINMAFLERVEKLANGRMQVHLRGAAQPIPVSSRLVYSFNRRLRDFRLTGKTTSGSSN